jgi:competence protein ComEC
LPRSPAAATIVLMQSHPDMKTEAHTGRNDHPRYHPLVIVLMAACAGILVDSYWPQSLAVWFATALISLFGWFLLTRSGRPRAAAVLILPAVLSVAAARHHCQWNLFGERDLGNYATARSQPIALEAVVSNAPRPLPPPKSSPMQFKPADPSYRFEISATAIRDAEEWLPVSGRAIVYVQGDAPKIETGDRIRIFGEFSSPPVAKNPGQFDRAAYLRSHRIRTQIQTQVNSITIVQSGSRWNLSRWLDSTRTGGSKLFQQYLDQRQAELAAAVFLGEREFVDYDRNEAFMATGTIHILSISGLHVGILAGAMLWIARWIPIPRIWSLAFVALVTGLYALMVDIEPPVVRSTILVLITCLSLCLKRPALSFNSLAAAALVVLAINPNDLFSVGAQLSFLCVATIMWVWHHNLSMKKDRDKLDKMAAEEMNLFSRFLWRTRHYFWELILVGAVIWIVTQPLVAARFHLLSPIALVLNAFVWIPMSLGLLSGFLFLFIATVLPPLAGLVAYFCNINLWLLEKMVELAAALPGSHFWVSGPENWWLIVFYAALTVWAAFPAFRLKARWSLLLLAGWTALGFIVSYAPHDSNRLRCTFLSVGHGSAVVLELPSGRTILYDAGQLGSPTRAANTIVGLLWSRGISRLDAVVLSHPDVDHYNALPDLLEKCSIGEVYVSPVMFKKWSTAIKALKSSLESAGVPVHEIRSGDKIEGGENCRIEVLHPQDVIPDNDNANSVVLVVESFSRRIILPGDLESPGLDNLLAEQPIQCDVLLAPHHGSRLSNSPELAAWCHPAWVIFSGDGRWSIPEIDATYQATGSQTLHTFLTGAVTVTFDKNATKVETFLK